MPHQTKPGVEHAVQQGDGSYHNQERNETTFVPAGSHVLKHQSGRVHVVPSDVWDDFFEETSSGPASSRDQAQGDQNVGAKKP